MEKISELIDICVNYLQSLGIIGGFLLVMIESIIPVMPLGVFIALNQYAYGGIPGFIISYLATVTGCMISFALFRTILKNFFNKIFKGKLLKKIEKLYDKMTNIDFNALVIILAMPFTPAFVINIAAGLSGIKSRKYLFALLISKLVVVYFWGYVSSSFLESIKDPIILLKVVGLVLGAYIISKIIEKIFKVEE